MAAAEESRTSPWGKLVPLPEGCAHLYISDALYSIGRRPSCSLRLHDVTISGRHCIIRKDASGVSIIDSSTNGTFVNGDKLTPSTPTRLNNGDLISFVNPVPILTTGEVNRALLQNAFIFNIVEGCPSTGKPASTGSSAGSLGHMTQVRRVLGPSGVAVSAAITAAARATIEGAPRSGHGIWALALAQEQQSRAAAIPDAAERSQSAEIRQVAVALKRAADKLEHFLAHRPVPTSPESASASDDAAAGEPRASALQAGCHAASFALASLAATRPATGTAPATGTGICTTEGAPHK